MEELTATAARSLIDGWAGVVRATAWVNAPRINRAGPTTVLVPMSKTAAKALCGDAIQILWYPELGHLRLETGDEVFSLYEGAP